MSKHGAAALSAATLSAAALSAAALSLRVSLLLLILLTFASFSDASASGVSFDGTVNSAVGGAVSGAVSGAVNGSVGAGELAIDVGEASYEGNLGAVIEALFFQLLAKPKLWSFYLFPAACNQFFALFAINALPMHYAATFPKSIEKVKEGAAHWELAQEAAKIEQALAAFDLFRFESEEAVLTTLGAAIVLDAALHLGLTMPAIASLIVLGGVRLVHGYYSALCYENGWASLAALADAASTAAYELSAIAQEIDAMIGGTRYIGEARAALELYNDILRDFINQSFTTRIGRTLKRANTWLQETWTALRLYPGTRAPENIATLMYYFLKQGDGPLGAIAEVGQRLRGAINASRSELGKRASAAERERALAAEALDRAKAEQLEVIDDALLGFRVEGAPLVVSQLGGLFTQRLRNATSLLNRANKFCETAQVERSSALRGWLGRAALSFQDCESAALRAKELAESAINEARVIASSLEQAFSKRAQSLSDAMAQIGASDPSCAARAKQLLPSFSIKGTTLGHRIQELVTGLRALDVVEASLGCKGHELSALFDRVAEVASLLSRALIDGLDVRSEARRVKEINESARAMSSGASVVGGDLLAQLFNELDGIEHGVLQKAAPLQERLRSRLASMEVIAEMLSGSLSASDVQKLREAQEVSALPLRQAVGKLLNAIVALDDLELRLLELGDAAIATSLRRALRFYERLPVARLNEPAEVLIEVEATNALPLASRRAIELELPISVGLISANAANAGIELLNATPPTLQVVGNKLVISSVGAGQRVKALLRYQAMLATLRNESESTIFANERAALLSRKIVFDAAKSVKVAIVRPLLGKADVRFAGPWSAQASIGEIRLLLDARQGTNTLEIRSLVDKPFRIGESTEPRVGGVLLTYAIENMLNVALENAQLTITAAPCAATKASVVSDLRSEVQANGFVVLRLEGNWAPLERKSAAVDVQCTQGAQGAPGERTQREVVRNASDVMQCSGLNSSVAEVLRELDEVLKSAVALEPSPGLAAAIASAREKALLVQSLAGVDCKAAEKEAAGLRKATEGIRSEIEKVIKSMRRLCKKNCEGFESMLREATIALLFDKPAAALRAITDAKALLAQLESNATALLAQKRAALESFESAREGALAALVSLKSASLGLDERSPLARRAKGAAQSLERAIKALDEPLAAKDGEELCTWSLDWLSAALERLRAAQRESEEIVASLEELARREIAQLKGIDVPEAVKAFQEQRYATAYALARQARASAPPTQARSDWWIYALIGAAILGALLYIVSRRAPQPLEEVE